MKTYIPLDEAWTLFHKHVQPLKEIITLPLSKANHYILAKDIVSNIDLPLYNKSAVDGYALNYQDTKGITKDNPGHFKVVDQVFAGSYSDVTPGKYEAINIMTGAEVPAGCNTVIRQEWTNDNLENLEIYHEIEYFDNICKKGEDVKVGDVLVKKGEILDFAKLAIISSLGYDSVEVYRKPRIALCVSGDEILAPGTPLVRGKIYESNMILLSSHLEDLHYAPDFTGYIPDDEDACAKSLMKLSETYDVIITTGGVSVGKKDIFHGALEKAKANKIFWKVQVKPGTPAIFSMLNGTPVICLSGNPFAALSTFDILARIVLKELTHDSSLELIRKAAVLENGFDKKSSNRRMVRAFYQDGKVSVPVGLHSSNALRSLIGCNCYIDIPAGSEPLQKGDKVDIWML